MVKNSGDSTNPKDKFGKMKPPLHLIPAAATIIESLAMGDGSGKYGPFNWRGKTVASSVYVAAALRHLYAWFDGETNAPDSGIHHLGHARACLGILLDAEAHGTLHDDRPTAGSASRLLKQHTKSTHPDKSGYVVGVDPAKDADLFPLSGNLDMIRGTPSSHFTATETRSKIEANPIVKQAMRDALREFTFLAPKIGEIDLEADVCDRSNRVGGLTATDRAEIDRIVDAANGDAVPVAPNGFSGAKTKQQKCRAYISGPMRGYPKYNFPAFDAARDRLNELGIGTFSPADMDRVNGVDENWVSSGNKYDDVRKFARRDAEALLALRPEEGDFVLVLPGWEKSTGAKAEVLFALWLGLPLRMLKRIGVGTWYRDDYVADLELSADLKMSLMASIADLVVIVRQDAYDYRANIGRVKTPGFSGDPSNV